MDLLSQLIASMLVKPPGFTKPPTEQWQRLITNPNPVVLPTVKPKPTPYTPPKTLAPAKTAGVSVSGDIFFKLADCETDGGINGRVNWVSNTGNGYYGGFQFSASTWNSMGTGYARADLAPAEVQTAAAKRLQARSGWHSQWPACSKKLGLPYS